LLSTVSDRVGEWTRPGMMVIGDAAHTMSPVGGQGLNIALRDAAVVANHFVPLLARSAPVPPEAVDAAARAVERERVPEVSEIQTLQAGPPRILFSQRRAAGIVMTIMAFFLNRGLLPPVVGRVAGKFFFGVTEVRLQE